MAVKQLAYVGFGVSDLAAWKEYASNVMGAAVSGEDGHVRVRKDDYEARLLLHPSGEDGIISPDGKRRTRPR